MGGFVDGPGLYPTLTARQNLAALAALRGYGSERGAEVDHALEQVGLLDVADDRAARLLARACASDSAWRLPC